MLKTTLRRKMLQKRQEYTPEEVTIRSQEICRQFFSFFSINNFKIIHSFLPIASKNEVNTWFIIERLRADFPRITLAVPVTDTQTLSHYLLSSETKLLLNQWGIPEPNGAEPVTPQDLDLVLVPLLAFDEKGHRVGYGKGYYDRFLAECRPDTVTVGLSLEEEPVLLISDVDEKDISLQFITTPSKVYQFH
ncbi:5-formyltetrahydrofolate cyclo-ligase [Adhaeribacter arboris]|uniref:5-formyltetrahydrofolate cyclo-ligase n=1 Tax=Adhaeribacter arboris TaxID=2072846 RepID=A0A2T2YKL6_9BACT|nr:5-formyltetrahydrofolate cyclo-ligase [Adhaeribacter arboris]PSR56048.1 5-formyltetrahydrofolate cyclo-ligase [Adhaeribacter arboris]